MAKVEIEIDDTTGKIGTLPDAIQSFLDKRITERVSETKRSVEARFTGDAVDRDELARLRKETDERKVTDLERDKKYEDAKAARDAQYHKDLLARDTDIQKRDARLKHLTAAEVRAAAARHGARDESLVELALILGAAIDLDPELMPFVKGADGKPAVDAAGQPVTIEGFVQQYLDTHPHHRAAATGTGGGARGGASFSGSPTAIQKAEETLKQAQARFRSSRGTDAAAGQAVLQATQQLKDAQAGKAA